MIKEGKTENFVMAAWLETVQNIVGPNGLRSVLNYAGLQKYINNFPPDDNEKAIPIQDMQKLHHSLTELFGGKKFRKEQQLLYWRTQISYRMDNWTCT